MRSTNAVGLHLKPLQAPESGKWQNCDFQHALTRKRARADKNARGLNSECIYKESSPGGIASVAAIAKKFYTVKACLIVIVKRWDRAKTVADMGMGPRIETNRLGERNNKAHQRGARSYSTIAVKCKNLFSKAIWKAEKLK